MAEELDRFIRLKQVEQAKKLKNGSKLADQLFSRTATGEAGAARGGLGVIKALEEWLAKNFRLLVQYQKVNLMEHARFAQLKTSSRKLVRPLYILQSPRLYKAASPRKEPRAFQTEHNEHTPQPKDLSAYSSFYDTPPRQRLEDTDIFDSPTLKKTQYQAHNPRYESIKTRQHFLKSFQYQCPACTTDKHLNSTTSFPALKVKRKLAERSTRISEHSFSRFSPQKTNQQFRKESPTVDKLEEYKAFTNPLIRSYADTPWDGRA